VELTIFSLLPPKHDVHHEQAKELLPYTRYSPFLSWSVIKAQLYFLQRSPARYLRALVKLIGQTFREPTVLLRALVLFPKTIHFARQMEALEIDHIHAHFVWLEGLAASVVRELLDIPFSIHPHAFGLFGRNQKNVRLELEQAAQIITISTYHRDYIANLCPDIQPNEIDIVYCGLETDRLKPVVKQTPGRPVRILSVGRFIEKKGFEYLIDACALLAERGLDFQCQIAGGSGASQAELQTHIDRHSLQDHVKLLGLMNQDQVRELYHMSDIFALACVVARNGDRDGIPVVLMEAMACEIPVVTTSVAGIPDLVQHGQTGLLAKERDSLSLANALEQLIVDEQLRRQLGKRGRHKILQHFQIQHTAAQMAAIFRRVSQQGQPEHQPEGVAGSDKLDLFGQA
jgi:glycosyltransferase involved in cell wall biosynthesis